MSKEYEGLAREILNKVGGKENVLDVYHCQTRLRFRLAEEGKADQAGLDSMDGVAEVLISGGVFQVVIGTHVKYVFEEIDRLVGPKKAEESGGGNQGGPKRNPAEVVIDFVSGTFQPIIPALSGAGMVKALLALLVVFELIDNQSQTYYLLNLFADGVFYYLPLLLAVTEAQKLKCNPVLAAGVAAIMLHPNWAALVTAGEAVHFFQIIPFTLTTYTGSVIPIILVVLVQAYVEKWLDRLIPKAVKLVFVPMLTFLIMGTLAFSVLGPIGSILGNGLGVFFTFLSTNASWAPAVVIGGFLPLMVMFGLHNGVAPLGVMQMADLGYDSIFGPGCVCSNIAQGVACLVVCLRTKDGKLKQIAGSASVTGLMGITEPALYGVNLPKKYPLIAAMIGGGCGGLYAGLTHTHRFATGSSGLPAVLLYIGDNSMTCFYNILIALVISAVVSGVLTYLLSLKFEAAPALTRKGESQEEAPASARKGENLKEAPASARKGESLEEAPAPTGKGENRQEVLAAKGTAVPEGGSGACEDGTIYSPMNGEIITLEEIGDGVFSAGVLGQGCGIRPAEGKVYVPFDGEVILVADTKHAIGVRSRDGMEIMIHVGLETVELGGEGFDPVVKTGDPVTKGQLLMNFDLEKIGEKYPTVTAFLITNSFAYQSVSLVKQGRSQVGEVMIKTEKP